MLRQGDKMNHQNIPDERTQYQYCRDDYYTMRIIRSCDELATCPGSTLPLPRDSWDWLQQTPPPPRPHKRDKAVTDNGWMDGESTVMWI